MAKRLTGEPVTAADGVTPDEMVALEAALRRDERALSSDSLMVGDRMRWSLALVEDVKARPGDLTVLLEVERIVRHDTGEVVVWLKHAEPEPRIRIRPEGE